MVRAVDPDRTALYRVGGLAALALGASYLVITVIYTVIGVVPTETGEAWLTYLQDKTAAWWAIVYLSALTDVLFFPVAAALYVALSGVNRHAMLAGAGLLVLFAVLDLAVTQISFAGLITLEQRLRGRRDRCRARGHPRRGELPGGALSIEPVRRVRHRDPGGRAPAHQPRHARRPVRPHHGLGRHPRRRGRGRGRDRPAHLDRRRHSCRSSPPC